MALINALQDNTMYDFDRVINRRGSGSIKWDVRENELPMWVADMDFECAPEILKALSDRVAHGIFGYTDTDGAWRDAYVNWWEKRHSFKMEGESLLFCSGIVPAVASIIRCMTEKGDGVLVMSPVYNIFFNLIKQNDRKVIESPLAYDRETASFSIDFDDLEAKMKDGRVKLLILCNPQNPVGKIWQADELIRIGKLAHENGVFVVSDEIHCDITEPGREYVPFASLNEINLKNSVTCISPTKAFNIAGVQTSAVYAFDQCVSDKIRDSLNIDNINEPNVFAVPATVAAFERSADWLDEMRAYVFENRKTAEDFIEREIPQIKAIKGDATYLMWADIQSTGITSKPFTAKLRENTGLFITPGSVYGSESDYFVRINLACPKKLVMDGLQRLKTFCDSVKG